MEGLKHTKDGFIFRHKGPAFPKSRMKKHRIGSPSPGDCAPPSLSSSLPWSSCSLPAELHGPPAHPQNRSPLKTPPSREEKLFSKRAVHFCSCPGTASCGPWFAPGWPEFLEDVDNGGHANLDSSTKCAFYDQCAGRAHLELPVSSYRVSGSSGASTTGPKTSRRSLGALLWRMSSSWCHWRPRHCCSCSPPRPLRKAQPINRIGHIGFEWSECKHR